VKNTYNQKFRSYKIPDIQKILDYQNKYQLNNSQFANHFQLSRNTVAKWKKMEF
jgi:DNA-binding transcriptional regulator YiaG